MKLRTLPHILFAAAFLFATQWVAAELAVPPLKARVTDLTNTLSAGQRAALEQKLAAFEARKGSQIAVLLVPSTRPETVEQYSIRVAEEWKLGRKGADDGVLLLFAMQDRAVRIEVGYGLEGALPDVRAKRIIEDYIIPRFRQGDFHGGIESGVDGVIKVIAGEPLPPAPKARSAGTLQNIGLDNLFIIGAFLVFVIGGVLRAALGRIGGSGVVGAIAGVAAWLMVGSMLAAILIGIALFVLSLFGGVASARGGRSGGWSSGGGGFGGGGGGFGGGGASGRW
ncbi:MAG: YgcG family protein [Hydrogenophaga sp.]|uniref:TPM domain-containing protein n=1 Tax=Hydrogenophaga sp. TaxID=1904254 RepID=UPI002731C55E|nr:YgcG family protein [Hydrogenophaga sp.]MDP2164699.1 YgcG family protein [Hydrogenophaga sp.]